jgi:hypothetical protein
LQNLQRCEAPCFADCMHMKENSTSTRIHLLIFCSFTLPVAEPRCIRGLLINWKFSMLKVARWRVCTRVCVCASDIIFYSIPVRAEQTSIQRAFSMCVMFIRVAAFCAGGV